jgi:hypothetical protein
MAAARVRNGFVPASRQQVFEKIRHLVLRHSKFAGLREDKGEIFPATVERTALN